LPESATVPVDQGLPLPADPELVASVEVLIVDDEHTIRESCATLLRQAGYKVTVAARGEDALQLLRRKTFHIILLDLYMKEIGEWPCSRRSRHGRPTPS
jgi:DNA-binding response OmpR family regulator